MPVIDILSDNLINKIAAGEVIERPASVVKELVENSIDSFCNQIRVDINYGGKKLIRVFDNGIGMDRDDALKCFKRHATSKIKQESDLLNINTMGFRGEALSSIASVSRMKIMTSKKDSKEGTHIEIEGGILKSTKDTATIGTTIEVRDLFFNTPARKKFLKTYSTELYHIVEILTQAALSYPDKMLILFTDEKEAMNLPVSTGIHERISQIYGNDFLKAMVCFERSSHELSIKGFASKEDNFRKARSHQYIFVNNRPVKDNSLRHAIYQAYKNILPDGKHPIFFIYIFTHPSMVDFNVHPAKREVRFYDKENIYKILLSSIKEAINSRSKIKPKDAKSYEYKSDTEKFAHQFQQSNVADPTINEVREPLTMPYSSMKNFMYIGEAFLVYPDRDGIYIIDHHASHERILYERLKHNIRLTSYRLLFPLQVRLPQKEYSLLLDHIDRLKDMEIDIDEFGNDTFIIRALPVELQDADMSSILSDIVSHLIDKTLSSPVDVIKDVVAKRIACHSSVRGKKILKSEEFNNLLNDLYDTKDPDHCPHGRPTRLYFSLNEIMKMFGRK